MPRLTPSNEAALRVKVAAGTATLLEDQLLGEIVHLRQALFAAVERLGKKVRIQLAEEFMFTLDEPTALEQRAMDGDR